jgi:hypothetical protein
MKLIRTSAEYVRRGIMNAKGEIHIRFSRSLLCNGLNDDNGYGIIQGVEHYRKSVGRDPGTWQDKPVDDNRHTHSCDCLRYGIRWCRASGYPMQVESAAPSRPERGIPIVEEEQ